jgi:hypothetical protein
VTYFPKSGPAKEIGKLMGELNTAQLQWNTYATQLGRGYTMAYEEHEKAIREINESYRLAAESAYWVLSLLCVSHAGALVGGLMAPYVNNAGKVTAIFVKGQTKLRTTMSETAQTMTQGVVQKGLDKTKPGEPGFKPAVKSPLLYFQDMLGELGICFSLLRAEVEEWMQDTDAVVNDPTPVNVAVARGYGTIKDFLETPLLKDYPKGEMPDQNKIAREAELGMWIAWANVRDIDYWKNRVDTVSTTSSPRRKWGIAIDELRKLQPVANRLAALGATSLGTKTVDRPMLVGNIKETIVDIPRLRIAGSLLSVVPGSAMFLGKVADVVKNPQAVLAGLEGLPPRQKGK